MLNLKKMQLAALAAMLTCGAVGVQAGDMNKNAGADELIREKTDSGYQNATADKSAVIPADQSDQMEQEQAASDNSNAGADELVGEKTDSGYKNATADKSAVIPADQSNELEQEQAALETSEDMDEAEQAMEGSAQSLEQSEDEMAQSEPVDESEAVLPDRWSSSDQHDFTEEPEFEEEPYVSATDQ